MKHDGGIWTSIALDTLATTPHDSGNTGTETIGHRVDFSLTIVHSMQHHDSRIDESATGIEQKLDGVFFFCGIQNVEQFDVVVGSVDKFIKDANETLNFQGTYH